jgi:tricorn protease
VDEASDGRIGYIYVPSTGIDGQMELARQFAAQFNKEGLIVDERFNSGGQIPDRLIELLNRKPLAFWAVRDGKNWQWPVYANFGPKVMLINGWSGSGGDAFPDYFHKAGLGPLVGKRTWGGLIGVTGAPGLVDGGYITVPTFRMYNPDGTWFKEGHGVDPDIEVKDDPCLLLPASLRPRHSKATDTRRIVRGPLLEVVTDVPDRAVVARVDRGLRIIHPPQRVRLCGLSFDENHLVQRQDAQRIVREPPREALAGEVRRPTE